MMDKFNIRMKMHDPCAPVHPTERGLRCREHWLSLSEGAVIMGVLNITPDSFYDGGKYLCLSEALQHTEAMLKEGAQIIDVGGASSRPRGNIYGKGAEKVSEACETNRVVPVVQSIRRSFPEAVVSVDTYSPAVALAALDAGAHMINDVSGLQNCSASAKYAAAEQAAYVVMHSVHHRGSMVHHSEYTDVVAEVYKMLEKSAQRAREAGVHSIIIDPGFGFGKGHLDNLRLINHLDSFLELPYPVLVGISRKSTVGQILSRESKPVATCDRLFGSLGITAVALLQGASIVRTHDVRETREMIQGMEAVLNVAA